MMKSKQARLRAAVSAAMGGAVALSAVPFTANAQDTDAPTGFSATNTGQVMIVPYYTVNGDWETTFNLTNTTDSALLVKVRVHEALNSRDILDFNVFMSPYDAWTGFITEGADADAAPLLYTLDESCTTPAIPADGVPLSTLAFTGSYADGGPTDNSRLREGYVEFLVIGECQSGAQCMDGDDDGDWTDDGIGYLTEHVNGIPRNCSVPQSRSLVGNNVSTTTPFVNSPSAVGEVWENSNGNPAYAGGGDNFGGVVHPAPLKGNVSYVNSVRGGGAGTEALHLDAIVCSATSDGTDSTDIAGMNTPDVCDDNNASNMLATAQEPPYFLEPTIATMPRGLWDVTGLDELEDRFTWTNVINEWALNPVTEAYTDWVVNFPTKGYHVDQNCNVIQANNNRWRNDGTTIGACQTGNDTNLYANDDEPNGSAMNPGDADGLRVWPEVAAVEPFNELWDGTGSRVNAAIDVYDREEGGAAGGQPIFSPGQGTSFELAYETNVIAFTTDLAIDPLNSAIATVVNPGEILSNSDAVNGWMDLQFQQTGNHLSFQGIPAYGFALKTRRNGGLYDVGQMMNHGYGYEVQAP